MALDVNYYWQDQNTPDCAVNETKLELQPGQYLMKELFNAASYGSYKIGCEIGVCNTCETLVKMDCDPKTVFEHGVRSLDEVQPDKLHSELLELDTETNKLWLVRTCVAYVRNDFNQKAQACMVQTHPTVTKFRELLRVICNFDFNHPATSVK